MPASLATQLRWRARLLSSSSSPVASASAFALRAALGILFVYLLGQRIAQLGEKKKCLFPYGFFKGNDTLFLKAGRFRPSPFWPRLLASAWVHGSGAAGSQTRAGVRAGLSHGTKGGGREGDIRRHKVEGKYSPLFRARDSLFEVGS